jgi:ABC-2 type transport system ATP-binding protein
MAMIETTNLTKHYGDLKAVRGIDLAVERGSIHGFVGPNGAGKSTTMGMLVGAVTPTVGEATIGGAPAGSQSALEKVGFAPQDPVFYESMSARQYLRYMGTVAGVDGSVTDRVEELLEWLELADAAGQSIEGYSGGMLRRLSLAQAMVHDPEVLILDEPTAELDPQGRSAIIEALQRLTDEGKTVFVSSHILAELEQFIETVSVIKAGQLVMAGPLSEVQASVETTFVLESTNDETLEGLLSGQPSVSRTERDRSELTVWTDDPAAFATALPTVLSEAGLGIRSLQRGGDLEDAFLEMVGEDE